MLNLLRKIRDWKFVKDDYDFCCRVYVSHARDTARYWSIIQNLENLLKKDIAEEAKAMAESDLEFAKFMLESKLHELAKDEKRVEKIADVGRMSLFEYLRFGSRD